MSKALLYPALTVLIWSGFVLVSRVGGLSPLTAYDQTAIRFATAALVLLPVWWRRGEGLAALLHWRRWVLAAIGGAAYSLLMFSGFERAPASHGGLLLPGLIPFGTLLWAWLLLRRPLQILNAGLGLASLGLVGFALVSVEFSRDTLQGDALFVAAVLAWTAYTTLAYRWQVPAWDAACTLALLTALGYLPVWLWLLPSGLADASLGQILLQALYQGVIAIVVAMFFYLRGAELIGPDRMGLCLALVPAVVAATAPWLLDEPVRVSVLICIALVVAGAGLGLWLSRPAEPSNADRDPDEHQQGGDQAEVGHPAVTVRRG